MRLPFWLLRLLPMWDYICPACKKEVPKNSHTCPFCREKFPMPLKVPSKVLKSKKTLEGYVHKHVFPKVSAAYRDYLTQYFTEIFNDGFESGDFSAWTGTVGTPSVTANQPHHGNYSMETTVDNNFVYKTFTAQSDIYVRFYFRTSAGVENNRDIAMLTLNNDTTEIAHLSIREVAWQEFLRLNVGGSNYEWNNDFPSETWICIEVRYKTGSGTGEVHVWVDGTERISQTGLTLSTQIDRINFGWLYASWAASLTLWQDCIVVADAYIGPEEEGGTLVEVGDSLSLSEAVTANITSSTWNGGTVTNDIIIEKATPVLQLKNTSGNPELHFNDGANLMKIYGSITPSPHLVVDSDISLEQDVAINDLDVVSGLTLNGSAGTSGQVLTSNGSGSAPTWQTVSGGSGFITSIASGQPFSVSEGALSLNVSSPMQISSGILSMPQANGSTNGYLSSSDWNTFNNKQNALTFGNLNGTSNQVNVSGGTGAIIGSGVTLSLPQNIHTGASPTFAGLTVNGSAGITNLNVTSALKLSGSAGISKQVLTSNGSGTAPTWQDITVDKISDWDAATASFVTSGSTATFSGVTVSGTATISLGLFSVTGEIQASGAVSAVFNSLDDGSGNAVFKQYIEFQDSGLLINNTWDPIEQGWAQTITHKAGYTPEGDFIRVFCSCVSPWDRTTIIDPLLYVSQILFVEKDVQAFGALNTASDPQKGAGGGCVQIGDGFEGAGDHPRINLTDSTGHELAITAGSTEGTGDYESRLNAKLADLRVKNIAAYGTLESKENFYIPASYEAWLSYMANDSATFPETTGKIRFSDITEGLGGDSGNYADMVGGLWRTANGFPETAPFIMTSHHLVVKKDCFVKGQVVSMEGCLTMYGGYAGWITAYTDNPIVLLAESGSGSDALEIRKSNWDFGNLMCGTLYTDAFKHLNGTDWDFGSNWNGGTVTNNIIIEKATPVLQLKNTSANAELQFYDGSNLAKIHSDITGGYHLVIDTDIDIQQNAQVGGNFAVSGYMGIASYIDADSIKVGGTEIVSSGRALSNVTASASIITSGTFSVNRIPTLSYSKVDFANQDLNKSNDAIFNSVLGTAAGGLKCGTESTTYTSVTRSGSDGYLTAHQGNLYLVSNNAQIHASDYFYVDVRHTVGVTPAYYTSSKIMATQSSSIRYKENIESLADCTWIYNLHPVLFDWKDKEAQETLGRSMGLIAEEVYDIAPSIVWLQDGKPEGIDYSKLTVPLLVEIQKLKNENESLKTQVASLEKRLTTLEGKVAG